VAFLFGECCTPNKAVTFEVSPVGTMSQIDVTDAVPERSARPLWRVSEGGFGRAASLALFKTPTTPINSQRREFEAIGIEPSASMRMRANS
jgi:hypothetical protein